MYPNGTPLEEEEEEDITITFIRMDGIKRSLVVM
jgi:hypothetical protein